MAMSYEALSSTSTQMNDSKVNSKVLAAVSGVVALTVSCLMFSGATSNSVFLATAPATATQTRVNTQAYPHHARQSAVAFNGQAAAGPTQFDQVLERVQSEARTVNTIHAVQTMPNVFAGIFAMAAGAFMYTALKVLRGKSDDEAAQMLTAVNVEPSWSMATVAAKPTETEAPMQDLFENYRTGYSSVNSDVQTEQWLECTQGEIPKELTGTLLRNGPALYERNGQSREYLDGDGLISQMGIKDGKVFFRSRFVGTDSFKREEEAGRFTDMSIFTAEDPRPELLGGPIWLHRLRDDIFGGPPKPKSNGAYNALHWAGKTVAIDWGRPWALNSDTLEVEGDGKTDALSKLKFTAHFRIMEDGDKKTIVFFNPHTDWAKSLSTVSFYEFDAEGNQISSKVVEFEATYFHDLIVTDNYYVLFDCPIKMDYRKAFIGYPLGENSLSDTVSEDTNKLPLFRLYPRRGDGEPIYVESPEFCYAFHHINGFDDGKKMVFDTCTWDRFNLYFTDIVKPDGKQFYPKTKQSRFVIDLEKKTSTRTIIHDTPCEYPTVAPSATGKPYKCSYMCTSAFKEGDVNGPLQNLTKVVFPDLSMGCQEAKMETWHPGANKFFQEPIFHPRPGSKAEDDGWVLALVHDGEPGNMGTELVILDAQKIPDGPIATVRLPHYVPIGVHGSFTEEFLGPAPATA